MINYLNMPAVIKENGVHESRITRLLCKKKCSFFGGMELSPEPELFLFKIYIK